jgi:hypothetical protein
MNLEAMGSSSSLLIGLFLTRSITRESCPQKTREFSGMNSNHEVETEPNKALERSRMLVTNRAGARFAPRTRLAHLGR